MNILMLVWFAVIEIGNVVFTFNSDNTKRIWKRNRLIVNGAELISYILFTVFPGVDFSFRFKGLLIVLIFRAIVAAIAYLVALKSTKDKYNQEKTIAAAVFSVIGAIIILVCASVPSFVFADYQGLETTGSYEYKMVSAILTDDSRAETFETDGSNRELPIDIYYPVAEGERFPLVVFSHGAFGYKKSNFSTYAELASNGYVVVSVDHPYHAFFCKDTDGKTITVNPEFINNAMYINSTNITEHEIKDITSGWVKLRMDDMSFVIDTFKKYYENDNSDSITLGSEWFVESESDMDEVIAALKETDGESIGVMGHSLGGAAAEGIGRVRDDVDAIIDIDGTMLYEQTTLVPCKPFELEGRTYTEKYEIDETPYPVPILAFDNDEHNNSRKIAEQVDMPYANNVVIENAVEGYDTYIVNSGHMNFTDLPLFSPFLAKQLGTGDVDAEDCITTMNGIILDFFNSKLKNNGQFTVEDSYECQGN